MKRRLLWTLVHEGKPLVEVGQPLFVFSRIFIKEQRKEINIILQEKRNEVIGMLCFFCIQQLLAVAQFQLHDLVVSLPATRIEIEHFLRGQWLRCRAEDGNEEYICISADQHKKRCSTEHLNY